MQLSDYPDWAVFWLSGLGSLLVVLTGQLSGYLDWLVFWFSGLGSYLVTWIGR